MKRPITVFICSTFSDLSSEREAVMDSVRRLQLQHDSMEFFGARSGQALETCLEEVRKSDVLVVIVGHRYGTIVQERGTSFSEAEYEEGHRLNKPCLVYIRDDDEPILPKLMETDPEKLRLLNRWKTTLRNRHTVASFRQGHDLAVQVAADLSRSVNQLEEAEQAKAKSRATDRPGIWDEMRTLVSGAIEKGLDQDTILSAIRRGLASAMAAQGTKPPTVFLSYSNADKKLVREFATGLEHRGISVWFDEMHLRPGEDWVRSIERALDSSDFIAFFMSQNSMRRGFVQKELNLAFNRWRSTPSDRAFILPVLLDKSAVPEMPPLLRDIQWLDATDGDVKGAIDRMAQAIFQNQNRSLVGRNEVAATTGAQPS